MTQIGDDVARRQPAARIAARNRVLKMMRPTGLCCSPLLGQWPSDSTPAGDAGRLNVGGPGGGRGVDSTNRFQVSVPMGQGLGLAVISEARASASVSIYSRMFVTLPFRTVMAKAQRSSNVLFVALILPVA